MSQQHPPTAGATDRTKVLSVRLTEEEFAALSTRAVELGIGPSTLARTLVRRALAPPTTHDRTASHLTALDAALRPEPDPDARFGAGSDARLDARLALVEARVDALERAAGQQRAT